MKSFLGNFYRHLVIFYWSHCLQPNHFEELFIRLFRFVTTSEQWQSQSIVRLQLKSISYSDRIAIKWVWPYIIAASVTGFNKKFATLGKFKKSFDNFLMVYFTFGKKINLLWQISTLMDNLVLFWMAKNCINNLVTLIVPITNHI